jgi:hypothetical protein
MSARLQRFSWLHADVVQRADDDPTGCLHQDVTVGLMGRPAKGYVARIYAQHGPILRTLENVSHADVHKGAALVVGVSPDGREAWSVTRRDDCGCG